MNARTISRIVNDVDIQPASARKERARDEAVNTQAWDGAYGMQAYHRGNSRVASAEPISIASSGSRVFVGRMMSSVNGANAPSGSPPTRYAVAPVAERAMPAAAPIRLSGACLAAP